MEVTITLESKIFRHRPAIEESARRALPLPCELILVRAESDTKGGDGISLAVNEHEGEVFDQRLRDNLVGAIRERVELEALREWARSIPYGDR